MEVGKLTVEHRTTSGKGAARRLRASGKIPGIYYGKAESPISITVEPKALLRSLDPEKKQNTVIAVTVTGVDGGSKEVTAMLRDFQRDSIRSTLLHVDLVAVDITQEVTVEVPIELIGKSVGVVEGGQLHAVYRQIPVRCKPDQIPNKIEVDISALDIGDVLHVGDISLPPGVTVELSDKATIASVVAPDAEVETKPTEEEEAAAAAGAVAAAGDKAGGDKAVGDKAGGDKAGGDKDAKKDEGKKA